MKYKAPGKCPVCGEKLSIIKLGCPKCSTVIEGDFHPCEFCRLPEEDLSFIKVFIKNRGNIKDIEKGLVEFGDSSEKLYLLRRIEELKK